MQNNTFFGHYQPLPVIVLEEIASTNDYAKQVLSNFTPQIDFTAIMAKHQTQGRGQRGTTWSTQPAQNLTASFCYRPQQLAIADQFLAAIHSSLAVYDVVKKLTSADVSIKWPNDIYVGRKKIAGILIENKIAGPYLKNIIAGIGLNVYQTDFPQDIAHKTTSLLLENPAIELSILEIVTMIQHQLRHYQDIYTADKQAHYIELYNSRLFLKGVISDFIVDNQVLKGQISGVDQDGQLIVDHENGRCKYDLKSIIYKL